MIISNSDFASFSTSTQAELLSHWQAKSAAPSFPAAPEAGPEYDAFDMSGVADLTAKQVQTWMETASEKTKNGLRVAAEHGPTFDHALLAKAGIDNIPHFQSRTTMRTRTVTGDKESRLFGWDDWVWDDDEERYSSGRFAVTPITHQSLRRYFKLD